MAIRESRKSESDQIKDLLKINSSSKHMKLMKRKNYYKEVSNLIELICQSENLKSRDCQHDVSKALATYIGRLYNRLFKVYKNEQNLTTKTTSNY